MRLTANELNTVSSLLRDLYTQEAKPLPRKMIELLDRVVPCRIVAYNEIDYINNRFLAVHNFPDPAVVDRLTPVFLSLKHEHPLQSYHLKRDISPRKVSDYLTQRQFERTGLYNEFYTHFPAKYQIVFHLPSPTIQRALALFRENKDFTEGERALLSFLSPHFTQAYLNAAQFAEVTERASTLSAGWDALSHEIVTLDAAGNVTWIRDRANAWLLEFFGKEANANLLPPELGSWAKQGMLLLASTPPPPARVGVFRREAKRLLVTLAPIAGGASLLLNRHDPAATRRRLQEFGLTEREAEVFDWLAEGKTDNEIASLLQIAPRTANKHVERILQKLRVENRTAAIRAAADAGLLG